MDTTLVTVTVLSMGMAAALSVIVWRLLRDERQRSEARVAALTEAARLAPPPTGAARTAVDDLPFAVVRAPKAAPVNAISRRPTPGFGEPLSERPRVDARRTSAVELPLHGDEPATPAEGALFAEPARSSPWGSRLAVMAGLALLVASAVLFAMASARTPAPGSAPRAASAAPAGLELLSLRDTRQADALTVTGMVQNPRTGSLLTRASVTAYAFDDKGTFLASGRALLDVTALAPGDSSPFVVAVPVTETVARYRIGFRSEDGRVIAHVDRRQQAPMAALAPR